MSELRYGHLNSRQNKSYIYHRRCYVIVHADKFSLRTEVFLLFFDGHGHSHMTCRATTVQCSSSSSTITGPRPISIVSTSEYLALEHTHKQQSEAGVTEHWDENNEQLECAGRGIYGAVIPGCPETFQSSRQSEQQLQQAQKEQGQNRQEQDQSEQSYRQGDGHQKVRRLSQGDIVATPVGVASWFYNDGDTQLVVVSLLDTSNNENELDDRRRLLAEAFGVNLETSRRIRGQNDSRGSIVRVENGLKVIKPPIVGEEREQQERNEQSRQSGLEESFCNVKLRTNIDKPSSADVYNPLAGHITRVNSRKLSILNDLRLNVQRGVLYRNAVLAPHWNLNAHSVIYVIKGDAQVQIVGNYQQPIYNGRLRQNQLLIVPQNFAVVKKAGDQGFEWVSFKTINNAIVNPIAGRNSAIRALPVEILTNAFRISSEEARRLKYNKEEIELFAPRFESQGREYASA
ncbi:hypothetical protein AQUCO_11400023v1 [Aquilegia coerulea]|uniref:Cupin type-1 domain-containing protein n=1 Tax=Aquilegia coerulea TaxID=218851 RepID=A0A2G5C2E5_AQUCA|nr:hypothetical protein AQUCO_11400023v1 [Aquilegia coerulea]